MTAEIPVRNTWLLTTEPDGDFLHLYVNNLQFFIIDSYNIPQLRPKDWVGGL